MCYMSKGCVSGHYWHGSSVCSRCGERLRCECGRFVREDALEAHAVACDVLHRLVAANEAELRAALADPPDSVVQSMAEKREAAARADEPKRAEFGGEWHTYDRTSNRWVPDSEVTV